MPEFDGAVVRRLKEAGFVVLGKTNTPELGITAMTESELNGPCRNPWDTSRTPGGSSGGAAAAVAAGLAPAAHGQRRRRLDPHPRVLLRPLRDQAGARAGVAGAVRRARGLLDERPDHAHRADAAALLDVMAGYETGDPYWAPPPERPFADEVGAEPGTAADRADHDPAADRRAGRARVRRGRRATPPAC